MGKWFVVGVFSLASVWAIDRFFNVAGQAFSILGVPFTYSALLVCVAMIVGMRLVKR